MGLPQDTTNLFSWSPSPRFCALCGSLALVKGACTPRSTRFGNQIGDSSGFVCKWSTFSLTLMETECSFGIPTSSRCSTLYSGSQACNHWAAPVCNRFSSTPSNSASYRVRASRLTTQLRARVRRRRRLLRAPRDAAKQCVAAHDPASQRLHVCQKWLSLLGSGLLS